MDSLLVVRHGRIVAEAYYAPFRPGMRHLVNSVTKAVVGTLAGIAVQSGEIASVDEPVLESFRWRTVANAEGSKAQLKIAHLLDMTSGLDWNEPLTAAPPETMLEMARSRDWVGFVLDRPMAHAPGTVFNYNSGDWHLVSAILARKTGLDTLEYARRTLFAPLGIADATWRADPQGVRSGGFGLSLQPRDMAKIGYLYLQRGRWAGQRIVSEAWIDRVFHATVDMNLGSTPRFRYASGWWTIPEKRAYLAVGFLRQLIIVLPDVGPRRRRHGQAQLSVPAADRSPRRGRGVDDGASGRCRRQRPARRARRARRRSRRRRRSGRRRRWRATISGQHLALRPQCRSACARSCSTSRRPSRAIASSCEARRRGGAAPDRRADRPRRPLAQPRRRRRRRARRQGTLARRRHLRDRLALGQRRRRHARSASPSASARSTSPSPSTHGLVAARARRSAPIDDRRAPR